jgi:hypothetical protein
MAGMRNWEENAFGNLRETGVDCVLPGYGIWTDRHRRVPTQILDYSLRLSEPLKSVDWLFGYPGNSPRVISKNYTTTPNSLLTSPGSIPEDNRNFTPFPPVHTKILTPSKGFMSYVLTFPEKRVERRLRFFVA